ncbi:hemin ABC transporter substrate-binding protein [Rhizobium sp. L1K21]|uniref:heme/hemin ABC transporter substrate-binding protein n=1 Tax=Rhizobium sp. L1K21 TaxID=2954933 RepID=UPI003593CF0E
MMRFTKLAITIAAFLLTMPAAFAEGNKDAQRIVAVGGSVTEIVYALGEEGRLIGRDSTSIYPPEALKLPDTGYIRALSPEGILSLNPDLILSLEGAGPPDALETLKSAGVPFVEIPEGFDRDAIVRKIEAVGTALGVEAKAESLAAKVKTDLDRAMEAASAEGAKTRVLFILSLQNGRIMAAGRDTHADGIIKLAGGENVMASLSGYKPVSNEAVIEAAPDVILMMNGRGDHSLPDEAILANAAVSETPAGKAGRLIRMDGMYLLGFGPRTADAIATLHEKFAMQSTEANP